MSNEVNLSSTAEPPAVPDCSTVDLEYDVALAVVSVTMGLFGLVYTVVGYRCFKAVLFLSGLTFGGTTVYVLCQEERILQHNLPFGAVVGTSIGIGVLCGLITMLVIYVGLFLQGFFLGVLLAIAAIIASSKFYHPSTPWIPVGILFGTGILFALCTLKWQKLFVVISTSVMGAALLCSCLEYFMEKFLLHRYIWENLMADTSIELCWLSLVILGVWPVLSLFGILIQWRFTGKGYDHTDVIVRRGDRNRVRTHLVRQPNRGTTANMSSSGQQRQTRNRPDLPDSRNNRNCGVASGQNHEPFRISQQDDNFDTLPPSYDDCVRLGVGRPLQKGDHNRIIRTKHGSFLAASGRHFDTPSDATVQNAVRRKARRTRRTASASSERSHQHYERERLRSRQKNIRVRKSHGCAVGSSNHRTPQTASAGAIRVSNSDDRQSLLFNEMRAGSSVRSRSR